MWWCAGINRHEAEDERALRERSSDPLGPEFCAGRREGSVKRKQGNRWAGYRASKRCNQDADAVSTAEGNMDRSVSASPWTVLRSRRPQSTPRNFMHENRETSEIPVSEAVGRTAGEGKSRTARMHVSEESDSGIVPMNHSNKDGKPSAESEEGRPLIKENTHQPSTHPTQSGARVSQGLAGVRKAAREREGDEVHRLAPPFDGRSAAGKLLRSEAESRPGVDGMTWQEYETGLEGRLVDLHSRVHRGAYRAKPSRRVYIPKADGRQRPLGVAALEDKIVQQAVVTILNQIYEEDFLGFSYGFRPGRSQHQALDALSYALTRKKVNCDSWTRTFGDFSINLSHEWLLKFVAASRCRPPDTPADPEMVEGRSDGGRRMVGDGDGYSARGR